MTQELTLRPVAQQLSVEPGRDVPAGPAPARRPRGLPSAPRLAKREKGSALLAVGVSVQLLALLAGVFVVEALGVGYLRHERSQSTAYAAFRISLAEQTAPLGQLDYQGKPLAMGVPVASLDIPAIGVHEVIGEGTTSRVLMAGAGHRRDTPLPGQYGTSIVYGRGLAYGAPFRRIDELKIGDRVLATTGQGLKPFAYSVIAVRRAGDPVIPLEPGTGRLTLFTSDGPWYAPTGVLRVDAELVGTPMPRTRKEFSSVPVAEQAMSIDRAALTPLLLWAQALLAAAIAFVLLRVKWGRWQAWVSFGPVLALLGLSVAHEAARLLPNLL